MPDQQQDERLSARLANLWSRGERSNFYRILVSEGFPKITWIVVTKLNLRFADAENCVGDAVETFLSKADDLHVKNPFAYITTSAINAGCTLHRRRKREEQAQIKQMWSQEPVASVSPAWAVLAVEESLVDVEAEPIWAVDVVELAIDKLGPRQQQVVRYLAQQDFDFNRGDLAGLSRIAGRRPRNEAVNVQENKGARIREASNGNSGCRRGTGRYPTNSGSSVRSRTPEETSWRKNEK